MRILTITDTNPQAQLQGLLRPNLDGTQTAAAFASLQARNPQLDLRKLQPGMVLLVPDTPSFQVSASSSAIAGPFNDFIGLAQSALSVAAQHIADGNSGRIAERKDVALALEAVARAQIGPAGPDLPQQLADATQALKQEQLQDEQAAKDFATANSGVLAKLSELGKLLG